MNACAIEDFPRACAWADLLRSDHADYFRGRLRFLIATRSAWDDEREGDGLTLLHWDLPAGGPAEGLRGGWAGLNAGLLYAAGVNRLRIKVAPEDHERLWDAVQLFKRGLETSPPSARFMLARCYRAIGDHHNAALQYEWLLQNSASQLTHWKEEMDWVWRDDPKWISELHECLIGAYDNSGETEKAIAAAERYIEAFPNQLGTYGRMARLYRKEGDHLKAYEWLRKEADRNPQFDEDPNISMALALGAIAQPNLDELLKKVARGHAEEVRKIADMLLEYWPAYGSLDTQSKERWAVGEWLRESGLPQAAGLAAHSFAQVAERELRANIFDKFREARPDLLSRKDEADDRFLANYLRGVGGLTLGQMLTIIGRADRSRGLTGAFGEWLKREHPWFMARFRSLRPDRIARLHRDEKHALRVLAGSEAATAAADCRALIELTHPAPGSRKLNG